MLWRNTSRVGAGRDRKGLLADPMELRAQRLRLKILEAMPDDALTNC